MASENETIAEIVKEIRQVGPYAVYKKPIFKDVTAVSESFVKRFMYGHFVTDFGTVRIENPKVKEVSNYELADRIEAAHRRELAELKNDLELTRQQRNRARLDAQEKFGSEIAELGGALKKAYDTLYSISCSRYGKGLTCTDDIHDVVTMARECSDELFSNKNLRKALEGARDEGK